MPHKIQKPKLEVKVYQSTTGKTISRVALLTGCVQEFYLRDK